jgi:hypothetical protein
MNSKQSLIRRCVARLVRILYVVDFFGVNKTRRIQELEKIMRHWHKEETEALAKWDEALACGNLKRAAMWMARSREARLRCNKDFRRPMAELMGKPDLFDANAKGHAPARTQRTSQYGKGGDK